MDQPPKTIKSGEPLFSNYLVLPVLLFFIARLISLLTLPLSGLLGYGDFPNYIQQLHLPGWPFINYWAEYPPIFPFIITILYKIASNQDQIFYYLLAFFLILVDGVNLILFIKIIRQVYGTTSGAWRILFYGVILISLSYEWWYLDSLAVLGLLSGLYFLINRRDKLAGAAIAFGALVKLFPILLLVISWRYASRRSAIKISIISISIILIVYGSLYLVSPTFTKASIVSQTSKGSWETVWALIDGNLKTGLLGSYSDRLNPDLASAQQRNPAVIDPKWTLLVFAGVGIWAFTRRRVVETPRMIAFLGFTFCILFLWSPGWSPQWILYLLPLILLTLPIREAMLLSIVLILVNILEWPVLLSRGLFDQLWVTVVMRTLVVALAGFVWFLHSTQNTHLEAGQKS